MKLFNILSVIILTISIRRLQSQIYTSVKNIEVLYDEEGRLTRALTRYIDSSVKNGTTVKNQVVRFLEATKSQRSGVENVEEWLGNPINSFRMINRAVKGWGEIFGEIFCDTCPHTYAGIDLQISRKIATNTVKNWPKDTDVEGAIHGILRVWRTYQLDLNDLFNGTILQTSTEPLSSEEIVQIGQEAMDSDMFYEGITWLTKILEVKGHGHLKDGDVTIEGLRKTLASAYYKAGMPWKSVEVLEEAKEGDRGNNYEFYKTRSKEVSRKKHTELKPPRPKNKYERTYEALCRTAQKSTKLQSKLKCVMKETTVPYYLVKTEIVNDKPIIVIFHDVISDDEVNHLRQKGGNSFDFSQIRTTDGRKVSVDKRVSQTAWLKDTDDQILLRLNRRIAAITGMDMTFRDIFSSVERYQVVNYGVGGMYSPHNDHLGKSLWKLYVFPEPLEINHSGDRIATWMFYLSSVKAGGATVFPLLKTRVPITKGSAVFWYNTLPNGEPSRLMQHAGCPVLLGSKWVANKWIRQHGQVLKKLCGRTEKSHFQLEDL